MRFGHFTTDGGYLSLDECVQVTDYCSGSLWKEQNEISGRWDFDYYHNNSIGTFGVIFYFMGIGTTQDGNDPNSGWYPRYSYGIIFTSSGRMDLIYQSDALNLLPDWLDVYEDSSDPNGWNHLRIERNRTGFMQVYRNNLLVLEANNNNLTTSEYINFQMEYDAKIDNFEYSDPSFNGTDPQLPYPNNNEIHNEPDPQKLDPSNNEWFNRTNQIFVSTGIIGLTILIYFGKKYLPLRGGGKRSMSNNSRIIENIKKEFILSDNSMVSLLGGFHRVDDKYKDPYYKELIPSELLTHRYLMHPIRLSIMKLLNKEDKMKSLEIKKILDISWGDYSNHIRSLQEKGFVELVDEFNEDGHVTQSVYIKELGRKEYLDLFRLLQQFTLDDSPVSNILENTDLDDNLYPE